MLEMKIKTKEDVIKDLQESKSHFKRVVASDINSIDDLNALIKSAQAIYKTDGHLTALLITG